MKMNETSLRTYLTSLTVLILSSTYAIYCVLGTNLWQTNYVFSPEKLHALALTQIQQHGNNTRALVDGIVANLRADPNTAPYISVHEDWMFNNAGGAMGAMYMIHASMFTHFPISRETILTKFCRRNGVPTHIRNSHWN